MPRLLDVDTHPNELHLEQAVVAAIHPDEVPDCEWNNGGPVVAVVLEGKMDEAPMSFTCLLPLGIATHMGVKLMEIAFRYDPELHQAVMRMSLPEQVEP